MSGKLIFKDPSDPTNGDMVVLDSGRLDIYNKIDGVRTSTPTTTLRKCRVGTAPLNAWSLLDGYWQEPPKVIISPKKIPTYFARGRNGRQKFSMSLNIAADAQYKYKIYPTCAFAIDGGSSGWINVGETVGGSTNLESDTSGQGNVGDGNWPTYGTIVTGAQMGSGTLTINYSWRTQYRGLWYAAGGRLYCHFGNTYCEIYLDVLRIGAGASVGNARLESTLLTSQSAGYGQATQSAEKSVSLGSDMCAWWLRKVARVTGSAGETNTWEAPVNLLTLNGYSFATAAETLYPAGEVFYLAIGR